MIRQLLFQIIVLSWQILTSAQVPPIAKPGCQSMCGKVSIPFPFGIGSDCSVDEFFELTCNSSKPFFSWVQLEVLNISVEGKVTVNHPVSRSCNSGLEGEPVYGEQANLLIAPFVFSQDDNRFTATGCDMLALMSGFNDSIVGGCFSSCSGNTSMGDGTCYGIKCCQTRIPPFLNIFSTSFHSQGDKKVACSYAFLVEQSGFKPK